MSLDARDDWFIRWISMHDRPSTDDVLVARQSIDPGEAKVLASLKRLEKEGLVKSTKRGRELHWEATEKGKGVMA